MVEEKTLPPPALQSGDVSAVPAASVASRRGALLRALCALALLCVTFNWLVASADCPGSKAAQHHKTNVILMISDGYGPASETFSRAFHHALEVQSNTSTSRYPSARPLDRILVGSHRSRSTDSLVTDSAAGATAFACAIKSYNGAIGVDEKGRACGTVFEAAKEKGWLTGIVVTSRLTDATPACFISHVPSRAQEPLIAAHSLGLGAEQLNLTSTDALGPGVAPLAPPLDLAIGGGGCYYLPKSHPASCRADEADLVGAARERGWDVRLGLGFGKTAGATAASQRDAHGAEFNNLVAQSVEAPDAPTPFQALLSDPSRTNVSLPLLALISPSNTPYEIDRLALTDQVRAHFPPLKHLAVKALDILAAAPQNKRGLLLMVEGSQIDLCAHTSDPACHGREIEAYQETVAAIREWVDAAAKRGERSVILSTSDHETGGLTLARQLTEQYPNYAYYPERLLGIRQSATSLSARLVAFARTDPAPSSESLRSYVEDEILGARGTGFTGPEAGGVATKEEVDRALACIATTQPGEATVLQDPPINTADTCRKVLADLMSRRAEIGWTTTGHTGVDVPVHFYATSNWKLESLRGNIENTEIGDYIAETLRLDLDATTKALRHKK